MNRGAAKEESPSSCWALGIDLGGTNVRAALVSDVGQVEKRLDRNLPEDKSPSIVIDEMVEMIRELRPFFPGNGRFQGIGVGAPGGVLAEEGIVTQSPHLPLWRDVSLAPSLQEETRLPVRLDNDANCFALGELHFGVGRSDHKRDFLGMTLGTGIGGAVILNEKLWHGPAGMAGEFGHMVVALDGPPCACGGAGCLEVFASGTALMQMAREEIARGRQTILPRDRSLHGSDLEQAALQGDELALEVFQRMGSALGVGLANLINITGIPCVVVGGKVVRSWDFIFPHVQQAIRQQSFRKVYEQADIRKTSLGDHAGILGAASLWFRAC